MTGDGATVHNVTEQRGEGTAPESTTGSPDGTPVGTSPEHPRRLALRRAPRYRAFVMTGAAIGVVLGCLLVLGSSTGGGSSTGTLVGYLVVPLGLLGGLLGGLVAVLLERPRRRR